MAYRGGVQAQDLGGFRGFRTLKSIGIVALKDLIVTKSISRFARNTVDSLITVRKLKEKGVEMQKPKFKAERLKTENCTEKFQP